MFETLYTTFLSVFGSDAYSSAVLASCADEFCVILTFLCIGFFVFIIIGIIRFMFNFIAGAGTRHRF